MLTPFEIASGNKKHYHSFRIVVSICFTGVAKRIFLARRDDVLRMWLQRSAEREVCSDLFSMSVSAMWSNVRLCGSTVIIREVGQLRCNKKKMRYIYSVIKYLQKREEARNFCTRLMSNLLSKPRFGALKKLYGKTWDLIQKIVVLRKLKYPL